MIEYLLQVHPAKDSTILDFFAGSGTTGQAVQELNAKDGGTRKFILATNNENNIAEEVTYPRLYKVINGYTTSVKSKVLLYEYKFNLSKLKNVDNVLNKINEIISINQDKYDTITKTFKNNNIKVFGEYKANSEVKGIPANLKYFKTDFIVKSEFPDVSLEYKLLKYITPLVELEFSVDITNPKVQIVINDSQLENLIEQNALINDSTLFMHPDIFLDSVQKKILADLHITIQEIPNYFFGKELWTK